MENLLTFTGVVMIAFGILQIILFFKMWGMTNDVEKIKNKLEIQPEVEDEIITEAQIKALNGEKEEAFKLYKKAFHKNIIELLNKTIKEYEDEDNMNYTPRDQYYSSEYAKIVKYYSKRVEKLGMELKTEKFDSYVKIHAHICKL